MTATEVINVCKDRGIVLWRQGNDIGYRGPTSGMTEALRKVISLRKPDLLEILGGTADPQEPAKSTVELPLDGPVIVVDLGEGSEARDRLEVDLKAKMGRQHYELISWLVASAEREINERFCEPYRLTLLAERERLFADERQSVDHKLHANWKLDLFALSKLVRTGKETPS